MTSQLPVPTPGPYKDRRGWLTAFGIVEIVAACWCLIASAFLLWRFLKYGNSLPTLSYGISPGAMLTIPIIVYCAFAALLISAGIGSIRCRNWARITMIVVSTVWLIGGARWIVALLSARSQILTLLRGLFGSIYQVVLIMVFVSEALMMTVLPAVLLVFYTRKSVKATCVAHTAGPKAMAR
jgi:uncharacterized membrane protein HdeD (DUF308 family)